MWSLDAQNGTLKSDIGTVSELSAEEMALLYWSALGAPAVRISAAIGYPDTWIERKLDALSDRLGTDVASLPKDGLSLRSGGSVKSDRPWAKRTATQLIADGLAAGDDAPFLFQAQGEAISRKEIAYLVARIRAGFRCCGLAPGSWVALDAGQRVESYLFVLATLLHGGKVIRLGETLTSEALRDSLATVPVAAVVSNRASLFDDRPDLALRIGLDTGATPDRQAFGAWLESCPEPEALDGQPEPVLPTDVALVGFTSGSTGRPRPVLNSHEAVYRSAEVAVRRFGFDRSDVFYTCTDITAMSAFRSLVTLPLLSGGRVLLPSTEARSAPVVAALECETFGVTRFTVVPNVLRGILKSDQMSEKIRLTTLRSVFSGSGVLDTATARAFRERFDVPVVDYYGLREIGTALYGDGAVASTLGSGGGEPAECLVRVLNDGRTAVAPGQIGEVFVFTDCRMVAPDAGDPADSLAGWHATGDLGRVFPEGRIEIVGRKRDIIKTADGSLVFPAEVESILCRSPAVKEAAVFSVLDAAGIERVAAAVIRSRLGLDETEARLEANLRQAALEAIGPHRTPTRIVFLDEFPRVAQRKPDIARLKRAFAEASPSPSSPAAGGGEAQ